MGTKRVQKTRKVAKTRQVPSADGGFATEVYYEDVAYWDTEYVADSSSGWSSSNDSTSGGYGE